MKKLSGVLGALILGVAGCSSAIDEASDREEVIIESDSLLETSLLSDESFDDSN